jgi:hypothetical protein
MGIMSEEDYESEGCEVKENNNIFMKRNDQELRKRKYEKGSTKCEVNENVG